MLNVKLSEKGCVFCGKKDETVAAKSKEHDFQGVVCTTHMMALLKRWAKAPEVTVPTEK